MHINPGRQLSAWFSNNSKAEHWAAQPLLQLCFLPLISLQGPNQTCRVGWIPSGEMAICFKTRILNELAITAARLCLDHAHPALLQLQSPAGSAAGEKRCLAVSRAALEERRCLNVKSHHTSNFHLPIHRASQHRGRIWGVTVLPQLFSLELTNFPSETGSRNSLHSIPTRLRDRDLELCRKMPDPPSFPG